MNRYEEVLPKLRDLVRVWKGMSAYSYIEDLEDIFPELKECEDEITRKEIINYFRCQSRDEPSRKEIHNKWINWLEKQRPIIQPKFKVGDVVTNGEDTYTIDKVINDAYLLKEHDCAEIPFSKECYWMLK